MSVKKLRKLLNRKKITDIISLEVDEMLKEFRVNNYRNFKDELVIDFSNVNGYKFSDDCITNNLIGKMIIYGKNGTGKTNLGRAITDLKHTLDPMNVPSNNDALIKNADNKSDITTFSYTFLFNKKKDTVVYEYSKSNNETLVNEKLLLNENVVYSYSFKKQLFEVSQFEDEVTTKFISNTSNSNKTLPFLSWIVNNAVVDQDYIYSKIYEFSSKMTLIYTPNSTSNNMNKSLLLTLEDKLGDLEDFLNQMDIPCKLSIEKLPDGSKELYFVFHEQKVSFLENASSGTISLFNFFIKFILPNKESSILYFDEFDAYFHYELAEKVVRYLKDKYSTSLVMMTTHNTNLMSNHLMRPDCLFILTTTEKLVPLCKATDRELREGHNLAKLYMNGEFNEE